MGAQVNNPSQFGLGYANSTVNNNFTNPSQLGLENVLSNWNGNFNDNNNNNHIVQQNDHSSVQTVAIAPNDNGVNCSTEVSSKLYSSSSSYHYIRTNTHFEYFVIMIRRIRWEAMNTLLKTQWRMIHGNGMMLSSMKLSLKTIFEIWIDQQIITSKTLFI